MEGLPYLNELKVKTDYLKTLLDDIHCITSSPEIIIGTRHTFVGLCKITWSKFDRHWTLFYSGTCNPSFLGQMNHNALYLSNLYFKIKAKY